MRASTRQIAINAMAPKAKETPSEWNARCVDYSRVQNYDTALKAPYDPDYFPGWRHLLDMMTLRENRELWVKKCSRAGFTENVQLADLRHTVANNPQPCLWVTGSQSASEGMMEKRIKRGFKLAVETAKKFRRSRAREHDISFGDMDFRVGWATDKMIAKQDGYARVYGDEVSMWPINAADMLRKRTAGYTFSKIFGGSSMDPKAKRPTREDPIWIEHEAGNQMVYTMHDPKTKRLFHFEKGDRGEDTPGLKWSQDAKRDDGTWDLDIVRKTAYYQTPDGTKITNKKRMKVVYSAMKNGRNPWKAQNPDAPKGILSATFVSPLVPLKSGDFGELAVNFLKAKASKDPIKMRTYLYEEWCAEHTNNMLRVHDSLVHDRIDPDHLRGDLYFTNNEKVREFYKDKQKARFVGVDVQQAHLVCYCEEFVYPGDHATIDWRHVFTWDEVEAFATQVQASAIMIDYGYEQRRLEVLRECEARGAGWYPCKGFDSKLMEMPYKQTYLDPYEGTGKQSSDHSILTYSWQNDFFKIIAMNDLKGDSTHKFIMYASPEITLVNEIASEERIDGKWIIKSGHQNHLWDCKLLCLLIAVITGIYKTGYAMEVEGKEENGEN